MELVVNCPVCGQAQLMEKPRPGEGADCCRCGASLLRRKVNSLHRTAAFSIAALLLYIPANIYPILRMESYGQYSEATVWDGCVRLFQDGQWLIALIVFGASILIPLLKLLGLFFLVATTKTKSAVYQRERTRIYKIIEIVGPWAMLDVFLLAVLVSIVKLEQVATVLPGPGLLAFTAVVVLTILASASFDPRLIWQQPEKTS